MFNHAYLIQFAYQNKNASGTNCQIVEAKNKKQAVEKTLKNLIDNICVLISVKRVPKRIVEIIQKHNKKVVEALNE